MKADMGIQGENILAMTVVFGVVSPSLAQQS